jgi:hypothetical protein
VAQVGDSEGREHGPGIAGAAVEGRELVAVRARSSPGACRARLRRARSGGRSVAPVFPREPGAGSWPSKELEVAPNCQRRGRPGSTRSSR